MRFEKREIWRFCIGGWFKCLMCMLKFWWFKVNLKISEPQIKQKYNIWTLVHILMKSLDFGAVFLFKKLFYVIKKKKKKKEKMRLRFQIVFGWVFSVLNVLKLATQKQIFWELLKGVFNCSLLFCSWNRSKTQRIDPCEWNCKQNEV